MNIHSRQLFTDRLLLVYLHKIQDCISESEYLLRTREQLAFIIEKDDMCLFLEGV